MRPSEQHLAHLYVWSAIVDILEGSSAPDREGAAGNRDVQRVIAIAKKAQQRLLKKYDATTQAAQP